jgi:predicted PurR-regulated permease PerM
MNAKTLEHIFFFLLLAGVSYLVWQLLYPFMPAIVLAIIIATVCYPLYERVQNLVGKKRVAIGALLTTIIVFCVIIIPVGILGYFLFGEAAAFYAAVSSGKSISIAPILTVLQDMLARYAPKAGIDVTTFAKDGAGWVATSLGLIFASTASLIMVLSIAFIGLYYLFKDGDGLLKALIRISPLPDKQDAKILARLADSVRSVLIGRLSVGVLQAVLTTIGFLIFGVPQAVLWGMLAAIAALVPMVGTALVFIPIVGFLLISESYTSAIGVAVWGIVIVGLVDNFVGPYLMSKGSALHPFLVLVSALGGLSVFGPVGFILGPVTMSFFVALIEVYETYISKMK